MTSLSADAPVVIVLPGVMGQGTKVIAAAVSSDGDHKPLVERINSILRDQMNAKFIMNRSMTQDRALLKVRARARKGVQKCIPSS